MRLPLFLLSCLHLGVLASPASEFTSDIVAITQVINLFAILVDSGQYAQFDRVFTPTVTANFNLPGGSILHGLNAITAELSGLANVSSQHSITTQYITVAGSNTANATTYITGNFFGAGAQAGQIFTEYGRYETEVLLGTAGWRISSLTLITVAQFGSVSIVFPNGNRK